MRRPSFVITACALMATTSLVLTTGGASPATASVLAATSKAPIVVGGEGDSLSPGVAAGFEAGIYRFNKSGGLDGRKIQFTGFLDDGYNGHTNLINAQQLVENAHVMAVAPFVSAVATGGTSSFLAQNQVPFIGWSTDAAFLTQPKWGFPIDGNQGNPDVTAAGGAAIYDAIAGVNSMSKVRVAFVAYNIAPAIAALQGQAGAVKSAHGNVVLQSSSMPVLGTTNYVPYAQAAIASHPNIVFEVVANADSVGLAAALRAGGYKGAIVNGVSYLPGSLAGDRNEAAALNGVYVIDEFPADENQTPAVKQALKDLRSVGQPPYLTSGVSQGYWSASIFVQMLKATLNRVGGDPNKVTGLTLQQTVNNGFVYRDPIPGGIGNEYFPAATVIPTGCDTVVRIVGTAYKQIAPYRCLGAVNWKTQRVMSEITGKPIS
jgi:ABC-type branched-subunit amino acid transport system substrate-binding protein